MSVFTYTHPTTQCLPSLPSQILRADWSKEQEDFLFVAVLEQRDLGKGVDGGGMKAEAVSTAFESRFDVAYGKKQLKGKMAAVSISLRCLCIQSNKTSLVQARLQCIHRFERS